MSIVLDPDKNFVAIQVMFVEEKDEKHGNCKFNVINSKAEFDAWKKKGYLTSDEITQTDLTPTEDKPGLPKKTVVDTTKIIQILRTWWCRLNWKEQNIIYARCLRQSTDVDGKVRAELDMITYRDMKLKACLKRWDAKDDNKKDIILNDQMIDWLDPTIARHLLDNFEKVTEASEEDLKN